MILGALRDTLLQSNLLQRFVEQFKRRYVRELLETLRKAPGRGREVLSKHMGRIVMTPTEENGRRYSEVARRVRPLGRPR
jgi:hypothetical protein